MEAGLAFRCMHEASSSRQWSSHWYNLASLSFDQEAVSTWRANDHRQRCSRIGFCAYCRIAANVHMTIRHRLTFGWLHTLEKNRYLHQRVNLEHVSTTDSLAPTNTPIHHMFQKNLVNFHELVMVDHQDSSKLLESIYATVRMTIQPKEEQTMHKQHPRPQTHSVWSRHMAMIHSLNRKSKITMWSQETLRQTNNDKLKIIKNKWLQDND